MYIASGKGSMEETISMGTAIAITTCGILLGMIMPILSQVVGKKGRGTLNSLSARSGVAERRNA
jgi:hypothetical protein